MVLAVTVPDTRAPPTPTSSRPLLVNAHDGCCGSVQWMYRSERTVTPSRLAVRSASQVASPSVRRSQPSNVCVAWPSPRPNWVNV